MPKRIHSPSRPPWTRLAEAAPEVALARGSGNSALKISPTAESHIRYTLFPEARYWHCTSLESESLMLHPHAATPSLIPNTALCTLDTSARST